MSAAVIGARELQFADVRYDRFHLPAFDGHVYVAIAEEPAFFTVAPWGYRVLLPWLVSALSPAHPEAAFFWTTFLGLTGAGTLLFLYMKRLGCGTAVALLATVLFGASEPVGEAVRYQFLVEPCTVVLELAFLLALAGGAGSSWLALWVLLGTLSKEFFLLLLPLVFLARRSDGRAQAVRETLWVAAPAIAVTLLLRLWWTPQLAGAWPEPILGLATALGRLRDTWHEWWRSALLYGLTPLAGLGALRPSARRLVPGGGYLFLATLVSPLLNPVAFFAADVRRLLLYALPAVLPLALLALDRSWLPPRTAPAPEHAHPAWRGAAFVLAALPLFLVDRYRRFDLRGSSDALRVLAVCRETLKTARELEQGGAFRFDPASGRFSQGVDDDRSLVDLRRVRWFLGDGWGEGAPREERDPVMRSRAASLIVPCLHARDLDASLTLSAAEGTRIVFDVNGRRLDEQDVGSAPQVRHLRIPAQALFRGDNVLTLTVTGGEGAGATLRSFTLAPAGTALEP